ncbi:MAG: DinB family protein [Chloroflexi bacterium]|nr:DinB family protein [Chloroflexota bacterium]
MIAEELRAFVRAAMTRVRNNTLESIRSLTEVEYHWPPGPEANPICFLLLHVGRVEDRYFHRWLQPGATQVWARRELHAKYSLPLDDSPQEVGNGWNIQQVRSFHYPPLGETLDYLEAVRASAFQALDELSLEDMERPLRPEGAEYTKGYYLRAASLHEASHQGAIDYIRGLYRSLHAGA